jgi:hypothetical protein
VVSKDRQWIDDVVKKSICKSNVSVIEFMAVGSYA